MTVDIDKIHNLTKITLNNVFEHTTIDEQSSFIAIIRVIAQYPTIDNNEKYQYLD
jgi:hypothetical protein